MRTRFSFLLIAALLTFSCKSNVQEPSTAFAEYISAFTGGTLASDVPVKVEFAQKVKADVPADGLLSFSPALEGQALWDQDGNLLFYHSELEQDKTYTAKLALDKLFDIKDKSMKEFVFSFKTAPKTLRINVDKVSIKTDDISVASVSGTVIFSEVPSEPSGILSYVYDGKTADLELTAGNDGKSFNFNIGGLKRGNEAKTLIFRIKTGSLFKGSFFPETTIPSAESFIIQRVSVEDKDEPYVIVEFSQPLDADQDLDGLLSLSGASRTILQREGNGVRIYFEAAGESVVLTASADIRSSKGQRLGSDYEETLSVREHKPAAVIPVKGAIVPDPSKVVLPFRTINLSAVDVQVIRIFQRNVLSFLQTSDLDRDWQLRRSGRLVYKKHIELPIDSDYHKWHDWSVDLSGIIKQEPGAIYRVRFTFCKDYSLYKKDDGSPITRNVSNISGNEMTESDEAVWDKPESYVYYDDYDMDWYYGAWEDMYDPEKDAFYMYADFPAINVLASNLGIIYKAADGKQAWVAVSDINTAEPVASAELVVYNYQLQEVARSVTDANGFARVSLKGVPFVVTAKKNGRVSYLKIVDGEDKSTSRFDTGGQKVEHGLKAFAYGERGVWRPGDTMHLTLLVDGKLPDNHPVTMEVYTPSDNFYCKQTNNSGTNGFYTFEVPTDPSDPTGKWHVWFKVGGASFRKDVSVEAVKPNRLKINLDIPEVLEKNRPIDIKLQSSWLTGAVASGLESSLELSFRKNSKPFKGYEKYAFDCQSTLNESDPKTVTKALDAEGKAIYRTMLPGPDNAPCMLTALLLCKVMEPGGDASFVTNSVPFSPFSSYVGVKSPADTENKWLETDKDLEFKLVALDSKGKPISDVGIEYKVFKTKWSWWWESRSSSLDSYVNGNDVKELASGKITSGTSAKTVKFRVDYPEWGRYIFYARNLQSGHASAITFLVDWPRWRGRSDKKDPDAISMITFSTDKKEYEAGEQATVYIPACDGGKALVSIENGSEVLSRTWVGTKADGDTPFTFTGTPEMAPNVYIHLTLLQPYGKATNDLPVRLYGVQPVKVTSKASHLEPVIKTPEVIRPQEAFNVKVSEKQGKPMTYTLAIVDEGLLDITGFKTPDPWDFFNKKEALGIRTWDLYDDLMGAYAGRLSSLLSIGGDENNIKAARKDNRFNPVVKFLGPCTITKGENVHKITLPMYVGSVRVMVVAGLDGAYGNAEKAVPVRAPLMILPTLPRVVSCGEDVMLPVNVFAMEEDVKNVKVSVHVEGQASVSNTGTELTFAKPGDKLVKFKIKTADREGSLKATVTAVSGSHKASETITVEVRNPHPQMTEIQSCVLAKGAEKTFDWTPFTTDADNFIKAEFASFPSVDWNRAFRFAYSYSYSCSEQLSSRGLTLLCAKPWLSEKDAAKADQAIKEIIKNLYARQSADGGFSYWPRSTYGPTEWVSSLVGQFLVTASAKGYDVDASVLASWMNYQKKCVRNYHHLDGLHTSDFIQAFRLYTLALASSPDTGAMNRLREAQDLNVSTRFRLAACYALTGKNAIAKELVSDQPCEPEKSDAGTFGTPCRDKAMIMDALVLMGETGQALAIAPDVIKMLSDNYSTQNVAFSSLALTRLSEKMNKGILNVDIENGKPSVVKSTKSLCVSDLDSKAGSLKVKNNSESEVFVSVLKVFKPLAPDAVKASESGLKLSVEYTDASGNVVSPSSFKQGDDIFATVSVSNTSFVSNYENLALSMIVPSGWEIFNERLMSDGTDESSSYTYKDIRDGAVYWYFSLSSGKMKKFKVRFQAAYEGDFVLPAVRCENMYDTHVFANTASSATKVGK